MQFDSWRFSSHVTCSVQNPEHCLHDSACHNRQFRLRIVDHGPMLSSRPTGHQKQKLLLSQAQYISADCDKVKSSAVYARRFFFQWLCYGWNYTPGVVLHGTGEPGASTTDSRLKAGDPSRTPLAGPTMPLPEDASPTLFFPPTLAAAPSPCNCNSGL